MQPGLEKPTEPGAVPRQPAAGYRSVLTLILVLAGILAGGYTHGVWTGRWSDSRALEEAVARLDRVPTEVATWKGTDRKLEEQKSVLEMARIKGLVFRKFVNTTDGHVVSMLIVCGPPGHIAVHTPDICFTGSGYIPKMQPVRMSLEDSESGPPPEFMRQDFDLGTPGGVVETRVYWSWSEGDRWQAPDYPRWYFAPRPYLYKLYVTSGSRGGPSDDPAAEFLRVLLPELRKALSPGAGRGEASPAPRPS